MNPEVKVKQLIAAIDADLPESADELVDELWYWVDKGHKKPIVTQSEFDKITVMYHSMTECLEVQEGSA
jgi:hypothetical protein